MNIKQIPDAVEDVDMLLFRKRLRDRLQQLGKVTHKQLAVKVGISESMVDKWFNGKKDNISGEKKDHIPTFNSVYKVSKFLGVSLDYFVNPNMNCLTMTNQMISDETGLDDKSIQRLNEIYTKPSPENERWLETLNDIIHEPNIIYLISDIIHAKKLYGVLEESKTPDEEGLNDTKISQVFSDENEYRLVSQTENGSMLLHTITDEVLTTAYWKELETLINGIKKQKYGNKKRSVR